MSFSFTDRPSVTNKAVLRTLVRLATLEKVMACLVKAVVVEPYAPKCLGGPRKACILLSVVKLVGGSFSIEGP